MKRYKRKYRISILAFCLLPNHYHFLIRQDSDIPATMWLKSIFSGYTLAVNKQENRTGTLFESRPKKKVIDEESYLKYIFCYIHFNPVKSGLVKNVKNWKFSNFLECISKRNLYPVIKEEIIRLFETYDNYFDFFRDYVLSKEMDQKIEEYLFE